jgi:hypothetical protein
LECRNCGGPVDPRRVELGYDYCLQEECQQRCMKGVHLAAVGVNKAADYYMRAEEVLPPRAPAARSTEAGDPPEDAPPVSCSTSTAADAFPEDAPRLSRAARNKGPKTTIDRLRERERHLDQALGRSYERFRSGEITAQEMHRERDQLVGAFNRQVMGENIRYRSLLRRR